MKIFNALFLLIIIASFIGCKKENDTTTLIVEVNYKYYPSGSWGEENANDWPVSGATVYIFKDINFAMEYVNEIYYDYLGNGRLKNKTTGAETLFSEKKISDLGLVVFESLQNGTYGVVVDISNLDKGGKIKDWNGISIKIPEPSLPGIDPNKLKFDFDIYPWMPSDIEQ